MARSIAFDGIGEGSYVTFVSALVKHTDEDKFVKISANNTVALCAEHDPFIGIVRVIDQQDKAASVQMDGFVTVGYKSTASGEEVPVIGRDYLVCSANLKEVESEDTVPAGAKTYLVVNVDATNKKVTFQLDD